MRILGMFARFPEAGKTKTRLAATIGADAAAEVYAGFVQDLLARCPRLADRFLLAITPADEATSNWFRQRTDDRSEVIGQSEGKLGDRIHGFFEHAHHRGATRTLLIGSDSPDLPEELITDAFAKLETADVVFVPATDGGFVLIGMRKPHAGLFCDIAWSTDATLTETVASAKQRGLSVKLLSQWHDVDVEPDLVALQQRLQATESAAAECPATQDILTRLKLLEAPGP